MALVWLVLMRLLLTATATCGPEPFALPIKDVLVNPGIPDSYMRGIPAQIGTPAQDIVMLPWAELNNTWIYDQQTYCDSTVIFSDTICQVRRGSPYFEGNSTSFIQTLDIISAGGSSQETNAAGSEVGIAKLIGSSLAGTEVFDAASTGQLSRFPIGIPRLRWDAGYTTLHALGMGRNSTYMNYLHSTSRIGARVWSIFWGRMWTGNNPLDGQVVLGGYDESKMIGRNHTQSLDYGATGCWTGMKVNIADLLVNLRNGEDVSILEANTVIPTCIVPQRQLFLEAPSAVYDNFERATNTTSIGLSFGLNWSAHLFDIGTQFDGDITVVLDSGLEIRVSNDQYVVPFVSVDRSGSRLFNTSQREVLIAGVGDQPATLGRYFLTAAYLMIDQDSDSFTLWQANPSTNSRLVPVSTASTTGTNCTDTSTPDSSPSSSSTSAISPKHISPAVIAGPVLAVVVLAIITALLFSIYRRRKAKITANESVAHPITLDLSKHELHSQSSNALVALLVQHTSKSKTAELSATTVREYETDKPREPIYELSNGAYSPALHRSQ